MKKLALTDKVLMSVDKSARYIGGELNSIYKDPKDVDIRFAMCFPDVYEIGMSHLGIQILYEMFNQRKDTYCERVYSPWPDLHEVMKRENIPLFALESQDPISEFDFIGLTLQYEMSYTNLLQILDLSGVPLWQKERSDTDPLVIIGGPCALNPEPVADFCDLVYIGEGETSYNQLLNLYKNCKKSGDYSRKSFLRKACQIPGIYVPSLYEVTYEASGMISDFKPKYPEVPETVVRQAVVDFDNAPYPTKPLVPYIKPVQDRVVLEIQRGCIRGCRFCQAGMIYRPNREKSLDILKKQAKDMLSSTGHEEISLSSLSSSDFKKLPELLDFLLDECVGGDVNISLPSLRVDAFSLDVMKRVQDVKKSSITFAPEAGSQRLRDVINKGLTKQVILDGCEQAFMGGWNKVKLYFMLGLPTEQLSDVEAIPMLANDIAALYYETVPKEKRQGRCDITVSTSFFVPKPFTPFQWAPMLDPEDYEGKAKHLKETLKNQLNQKSIHYQWHDSTVTVLEGVLARGDRKLSSVLYDVYTHGGMFDSWTDYFREDLWENAFKNCSVDPDFYTKRPRDVKEKLPWDFIDAGVTRAFLEKEWETAQKEVVTPNCRMKCSGCGAAKFKSGVCFDR